jgi:opacity protein-like surface antigen
MTRLFASLNIAPVGMFARVRILRNAAVLMVCLLCLFPGLVQDATAADDAYIAGYAAAVLHNEFKAPKASVLVQNGVVTVDAESLGTVDRTKVQAALATIPGVTRVEIREGPAIADIPSAAPPQVVKPELSKSESKFLPHGLLFAPLHADPRWPHFSIASRRISSGTEPKSTGSANFGETFALYRDAAPLDGQWDIAIQAGVFSIFNMDTASKDLVNADYTAGLLASYRTGAFSGFLRFHHQSSHLGDEFILNSRTPVNRLNLSFEEVDAKLSYELTSWFRVYGGGGVLVGKDPTTLGIGTSQFGAELNSPWTLLSGKIRPVVYADFQANERSNWAVSRSLMAGLQFENARIGDRKLLVLVEYFKGPSPNGQFFTQSTDWLGLGIHLYY